jgi:hypothetical protein
LETWNVIILSAKDFSCVISYLDLLNFIFGIHLFNEGSNAPMLGGVGPDANGQNNSSGVVSNSKNNIATGK